MIIEILKRIQSLTGKIFLALTYKKVFLRNLLKTLFVCTAFYLLGINQKVFFYSKGKIRNEKNFKKLGGWRSKNLQAPTSLEHIFAVNLFMGRGLMEIFEKAARGRVRTDFKSFRKMPREAKSHQKKPRGSFERIVGRTIKCTFLEYRKIIRIFIFF